MQLRALLGSMDSYDLEIGPVHRIILGLSTADLQTQIQLEPSRIEDRDWSGMTPLMWAALRGSAGYLNLLLTENARIDSTDVEGRTALHHAVRGGSFDCVKALLKFGANPKTIDNYGKSSLHYAVHLRNSLEVERMIRHLLDHGADLESKERAGHSPLHCATVAGNREAVLALLRCNADINALDLAYYSPIGSAIFQGNDLIVEQLCKYGPMLSWTNPKKGFSMNVLELAAFYGTIAVMDVLANSAIPPIECDVEWLKYMFNIGRSDIYGKRFSPEEEHAAFRRLLRKKAIPIKLDEDVNCPLEVAHDILNETGVGEDSDQEEDFEDAVEDISLLHVADIPGSFPIAVTP